MTTTAQAREAERLCRLNTAAAQPLLQIDRARATPREMEIYERAKAAKDFNEVLTNKEVNDMSQRGILFFAPPGVAA